MEWETADQLEKRIVGSGWGKIAGGTRVQSPKSNLSNGGDPLSENNTKKIINTLLSCHTFFTTSERKNESMINMSVPI